MGIVFRKNDKKMRIPKNRNEIMFDCENTRCRMASVDQGSRKRLEGLKTGTLNNRSCKKFLAHGNNETTNKDTNLRSSPALTKKLEF